MLHKLLRWCHAGRRSSQRPADLCFFTDDAFMSAFSLPRLTPKTEPARSRRVRIETTGVASESVVRAPEPRLAGIVAGEYQGWTESSTEVVRRREVPFSGFPFIINFGSPFRIMDSPRQDRPQHLGTFVAGIHDSFVVVESQGHSCCIQVNFTPIGARLFFQLPLWELSNRSIAFDDLFGQQSLHIVETLAATNDWDRRFDLLEALIFKRMSEARPPRPEILGAWAEMQTAYGVVDITGLARKTGWSHKHLIAQFRDQVGAPPRRLGRILRFQRAIKRLGPGNQARWAALAIDCGYFDQSHMIREFREFAGCTPAEYVGLQLPYGGVSADSALR
jgi:AraC-like DNA-binding protein